MALRHLEGFETRQNFDYYTRLYDPDATSGAITNFTEGRKLGSSARAINCLLQTEPLVSPVENTWIVGFGFYMEQTATAAVSIMNASGTAQLSLNWAAGTTPNTFTVSVKRGSTTLATSAEFMLGQWHFFELKATVRTSTNGSYELRRNGVNILSASGVNTANTGADGASVFSFNWGGGIVRLDDIYICDGSGSAFNDFLGDKAIAGSLPTTAGASTQWLPSTSTNVSCVDDPASGPLGDYVASNIDGDLDLYEFADLSSVAADGTVDAIMVFLTAEMLNSGSRGLKVRFRNSGGSTADSAQFDVTLKGTLRTFPIVFEQDPVAAAAWTLSAYNGGQFGPLNFVEL
jgi:hypothetical protein